MLDDISLCLGPGLLWLKSDHLNFSHLNSLLSTLSGPQHGGRFHSHSYCRCCFAGQQPNKYVHLMKRARLTLSLRLCCKQSTRTLQGLHSVEMSEIEENRSKGCGMGVSGVCVATMDWKYELAKHGTRKQCQLLQHLFEGLGWCKSYKLVQSSAWEIGKDPGSWATHMARVELSMIPSKVWLTCEISS